MKTVDITPLKDNDVEYEKLVSAVAEKYKCEWDDAVHDSYGRYLSQIQENSRNIHGIRCKAEMIVQEMANLKTDQVGNRVNSLCKEADSI